MGYKPLTNWDAHHSRIHGPVATQLADDGETTCSGTVCYGSGSKPVPLVNIKIAGKWMFIPLKMVLIGIDS